MEGRLVYITFGSKEEALAMCRHLVENQLAACANILPQSILSIYQWDGKTEETEEIMALCKTTKEKESALYEHVQKHHSYDVAAIFSIDLSTVSPAYAKWVESCLG